MKLKACLILGAILLLVGGVSNDNALDKTKAEQLRNKGENSDLANNNKCNAQDVFFQKPTYVTFSEEFLAETWDPSNVEQYEIDHKQYSNALKITSSLQYWLTYVGFKFRADAMELNKTVQPLLIKIGSVLQKTANILVYAVSDKSNHTGNASSEAEVLPLWMKTAAFRMQGGADYVMQTITPLAKRIGVQAKETIGDVFYAISEQNKCGITDPSDRTGKTKLWMKDVGCQIQSGSKTAIETAGSVYGMLVPVVSEGVGKVYDLISSQKSKTTNSEGSFLSSFLPSLFHKKKTETWSEKMFSAAQKNVKSTFEKVKSTVGKLTTPKPKSWSTKLLEWL